MNHLDIVSNYLMVFTDNKIRLILIELEWYVNGAITQVDRVKIDKNKINQLINKKQYVGEKGHVYSPRLFLDAHFYFICIGRIDKFFNLLKNNLKNKKIDALYKKFAKKFKKEIRDNFEHSDERILGMKKKNLVSKEEKKSWHSDFFNYDGNDDSLTFGGQKYPVNKESSEELIKIFKELINIINQDYALKDSNFVEMEKLKILLRSRTQ